MIKTKSRFIVVKHDAKKARLHYDLRFVMPDSKNWMSFAVRKGVPEKQGTKVLAVRTHDHSDEEALFLGTIESGYGAGKLTKYDDGQCIILKFSPSHMIINFQGRKIKGVYHLINIAKISKNKRDYKKQQYMLFKGKAINEWSGLAYLTPPDKYEDVDEPDTTGPDLKWSKTQREITAEQIYKKLKSYLE